MTNNKPVYDESSIRQIKPHEHIRLRPGMYVGGTDKNALHHLFHEVFDNAIDEAIAGHCDHIWITLRPNHELSIRDNGRGMDVKITSHGENMLQLLMTQVFVGRRSEKYSVSGGLHGVGITVVNALAAECSAEVARDAYLWRQMYEAGTPVTEVIQVRSLAEDESTGTCITIQPDFTIFEPNEFDYEILAERAREVAYLVPNLTITLRDERENPPREGVYHFADGLSGYIKYLNQASSMVHSPFTANLECTIQSSSRDEYKTRIEVAFQYTDTMVSNIVGYVNTVRTAGGFHTDIVPSTLFKLINLSAKQLGFEAFTITEIMPGMTAIVSVWHPHPSFESQTNITFIRPEMSSIVAVALEATMQPYAYFDDNIKQLIQKLLANRRLLQDG
ncbi:MAG: ATP-binding protein [Chloroflexota bacterium]